MYVVCFLAKKCFLASFRMRNQRLTPLWIRLRYVEKAAKVAKSSQQRKGRVWEGGRLSSGPTFGSRQLFVNGLTEKRLNIYLTTNCLCLFGDQNEATDYFIQKIPITDLLFFYLFLFLNRNKTSHLFLFYSFCFIILANFQSRNF